MDKKELLSILLHGLFASCLFFILQVMFEISEKGYFGFADIGDASIISLLTGYTIAVGSSYILPRKNSRS